MVGTIHEEVIGRLELLLFFQVCFIDNDLPCRRDMFIIITLLRSSSSSSKGLKRFARNLMTHYFAQKVS